MARIKTYSSDVKVSGSDSWIGSDGDSYNKTKNFTPNKVAEYLNSFEKIDRANAITFTYQTLDPEESRSFGTISFDLTQPSSVSFSDISDILVSKRSNGLKYIEDFLSNIVNTTIILHKGDSINQYGIYKVISIEDYTSDDNFFVFTLQFIQGNGVIEEDKEYVLSVLDFSQGGVSNHNDLDGLNQGDYIHLTQLEKDKFDSLPNEFATNTSDLVNNGSDATSTYVETDELGTTAFSNDYNDLDNLPTIPEAVTKTSDLINDGEDGVNPFITLSDIDLSSKLDKDFSSLPNATTPLLGSEELAIIQDGETKKVEVNEISFGSKKSFAIEIPVSQILAASTDWYSRLTTNQNIFNATFSVNASLTPINDFANHSIQSASNLIPFDCKIKSVQMRGHSNSAATDIRVVILKSDKVISGSSTTIINPVIIADKTFLTRTSFSAYYANWDNLEMNLTETCLQGSEIRMLIFNNNATSNLYTTVCLIEFEEL